MKLQKRKLTHYNGDGDVCEERYAVIGANGAVEFHYQVWPLDDKLAYLADVQQKTRLLKSAGIEVHSREPWRGAPPKPSTGHCPWIAAPCYCGGYGMAAVRVLEVAAYRNLDEVEESYIWGVLADWYSDEFGTHEEEEA